MRLALIVSVLAMLVACRAGTSATKTTTTSTTASSTTTTTAPEPPAPVLLAAGDIATCAGADDEATADVIAREPDAVVAPLGDLAYDRGTAAEFRDCYGPSWGRFKARTHPAIGNHEYGTGSADAYFAEWGAAAGRAGEGWYSYDLGAWHVVALNGNCEKKSVGGCGPDSPQGRWLAADLAAHRTRCALAYWHQPRWSSGLHGSSDVVDPLWRAVVAGGVDVVLNGHDHHYERFGLIDGVREFVVGTGGAPRYPIKAPIAGSEVRHAGTPGVLRLTLHPDRYDWRFVPAAETTFADTGSSTCR